jgi:hypothetical protein
VSMAEAAASGDGEVEGVLQVLQLSSAMATLSVRSSQNREQG